MEEWKTIKRYPRYQVSNFGRIKNSKGLILSPAKNKKWGYLSVSLYSGDGLKNRKRLYIHRLMMMTFKPIKNMDKLVINHIDCNPSNNNISNLEWVTFRENIAYAAKLGRTHKFTDNDRKLGPIKNSKKVIRSDGKIFSSMSAAAKAIKRTKTMISWCCCREGRKVKGYSFRVID